MRPPYFVPGASSAGREQDQRTTLGNGTAFSAVAPSGPQSSSVDQYSETPPEHLASNVAEATRRSVVTRHCLSKKIWIPKRGVCPVVGVLGGRQVFGSQKTLIVT